MCVLCVLGYTYMSTSRSQHHEEVYSWACIYRAFLHFGPVPWDNCSLLRSHSLWLSRYQATFYKKGLWMLSDICWCRLSPPRQEVPRQAAQTDQTHTSRVPSPLTCSYPGVSWGYLPGKIHAAHSGNSPSPHFAPCSCWYFFGDLINCLGTPLLNSDWAHSVWMVWSKLPCS